VASYEDTMFFPRLRRHAKWMFVFLALVFGVGFVAFGIGASGTGIGDLFRDSGGGSEAPSVSAARQATEEDPKDAEAWRDLSIALQTEGETAEAITALERYLDLRPKDVNALRELGGLHLAQGAAKQRDAQVLQLQGIYAGAGNPVQPTLFAEGSNALGTDRLTSALQERTTAQLTAALSAAGASYTKAVATYRRLADATPKDASVQLELAQAAEQGNDAQTAIAAYEQFLKLAPDDPQASIVRQQLKQLRAATAG
jgi:tetratricopeptide (TPR) repeat protein